MRFPPSLLDEIRTRLPVSQAEDLIIGLRALVDLAGPVPETRNDQ